MFDSEILCQYGDEWIPIPVSSYPDGTPMVKASDISYCQDILVRPTSLSNFVASLLFVDAVRERGGNIRSLILPMVPGGRQDRLNPEGDYLFTLKSVAQLINDRGFVMVHTIDPHSNVTPALIDRCQVVSLRVLGQFVGQESYQGVIAPDLGAAKRAEDFGFGLGLPVIYASKRRDVATGKLSGFAVEVEKGAHYLVVDDICDGGGTFLGLAEKIEAGGATASLYVTHGLFTKGTGILKEKFKEVYCTNSTVGIKPWVNVINIFPYFGVTNGECS